MAKKTKKQDEHEHRCPIELIDKVSEIYERQIDRIIKLLSEKK